MYRLNRLYLTDLTIEHMRNPLGIDVESPRFAWKLHSDRKNVRQTSYHLRLYDDSGLCAESGAVSSEQSIEVMLPGFRAKPQTRYEVRLEVTDNKGARASLESYFESGKMDQPFRSRWVEPKQQPTPSSMDRNGDSIIAGSAYVDGKRDFHEFMPAQYVRIPFRVEKGVRRARIYATDHGLYRLTVNGVRPDDREFAPENTAYNKLMYYQTYDVTGLLKPEENVIGVILADGWWAGRVGTTGDCCQYGNTTALLLDAEIEYMDGTKETVTGEAGVSSTGPIIFSDLFVGEKYDARKEMPGWDCAGFDDSGWEKVIPMESGKENEGKENEYRKDNLKGQPLAPVRPVRIFHPERIFTAPNGDMILDAGQTLAGNIRFTVTAKEGDVITLEHFEVLDQEGNYFNPILNNNKEQTEIYIAREGTQTYQPAFTYHGFRYVRIRGWRGTPSTEDFTVYAYSSAMDEIGSFHTSDERINQLQSNIWWSQISNTISIPTDCPQREKAGWTGDIMVYSPTMCFNTEADAFLSSWMDNVRAEQMEDGAIPMIVPYLKAYATFLRDNLGADTSCGWGDAVIMVPYSVYRAYGDRKILEENYDAMTRWMEYIDSRAANSHPEGYENWDETRKARSRYLWNTDFHFGDWLIPSIVLNNPDANAMNDTAYATMGTVAPAYYAFSAKNMAEIARILGKKKDAEHYEELYGKIRQAFIEEYVHEDGTMDADFQGIYVIALKMGLVTDEVRPKMVQHLCDMIRKNSDRLDTGFLSVRFLMDVLCENGRSDVAYKLLFQEGCPGWLYEVEKGATTMWESWGAVAEDGTVSTYSYNHYAFGCIGEWMYQHLGGLNILEAGYKRFRVEPAFDSGLTSVSVSEETPYGTAAVDWEIVEDQILVHVTVPANTEAEICLPGRERETVGSGTYSFLCQRPGKQW